MEDRGDQGPGPGQEEAGEAGGEGLGVGLRLFGLGETEWRARLLSNIRDPAPAPERDSRPAAAWATFNTVARREP